MTEDEASQQVTTAIRILGEIAAQIERDISRMPPRAAFAEAGRLRDALEQLRRRASALRVESVQHLYTQEGLSMAEIGARLGLSKPRIDQLVKEAKRRK